MKTKPFVISDYLNGPEVVRDALPRLDFHLAAVLAFEIWKIMEVLESPDRQALGPSDSPC
jgi:hypothetical protein